MSCSTDTIDKNGRGKTAGQEQTAITPVTGRQDGSLFGFTLNKHQQDKNIQKAG
jgi:hypothetical protein